VVVARHQPAATAGDLSRLRIAVIGLGGVGRATVEALALAGARDVHAAGWTGALPDLQDRDVCVAAADVPAAPALLELNARCIAGGVPLLPGLAMGAVGQVGPLVRAGTGPCLRCADLRLRAATGRSCLAPYGPPDARTIAVLARALTAGVAELEDPEATRALAFHWADGSVTRHPVLRTWRCPDCTHAGPQPAYRRRTVFELRDRPPSRRDHILGLRPRLVDAVTGPITSLDVHEPAAGDPPVRHAIAVLVDEGWQRAGHPVLHCGGGSVDAREAEAAALGEAVERASAVLPPAGDLVVAPYRDVEPDAVDPGAWDLFHARTRAEPGFPYRAPARDDPISWAWGWSLTRKRPALVPAARVFVPFESPLPGDFPDYPLLSGFAAGNTLEEAARRALLEVVERDAFMIAWANRLPLRRVGAGDGRLGAHASLFAQPGLEARCGLVDLDLGAPVAIAIVRSTRAGDPAVVVAAAADTDAAGACRRALGELTANRLNVRHTLAQHGLPAAAPADIRDETAHGLLYARPDMAAELLHWWEAPPGGALPPAPPPASAWAELSGLVAAIGRAGLEVLLVDLTPPEIRELGLRTVKALVPGAYPMNFDSRWPHFGGTRMTAAPVRAGLRRRPLGFEEINRVPHPFP
jgi:ribosomal protein S12 methylthiotransferase accessory factor